MQAGEDCSSPEVIDLTGLKVRSSETSVRNGFAEIFEKKEGMVPSSDGTETASWSALKSLREQVDEFMATALSEHAPAPVNIENGRPADANGLQRRMRRVVPGANATESVKNTGLSSETIEINLLLGVLEEQAKLQQLPGHGVDGILLPTPHVKEKLAAAENHEAEKFVNLYQQLLSAKETGPTGSSNVSLSRQCGPLLLRQKEVERPDAKSHGDDDGEVNEACDSSDTSVDIHEGDYSDSSDDAD